MNRSTTLAFKGINAVVSITVDQRFLRALKTVFGNWPYRLLETQKCDTFANVVFKNGNYTLDSPFIDAPKTYQDPVNTICSLIVELAWAHLRSDPDLLCLHCAAVEKNSRLILFPNSRRSGKSTLSVAMMSAGYRLYTDDFLPLKIGNDRWIYGFAQGISPRIRLPLPDQIGSRVKKYLVERDYISNRQYHYVVPGKHEAAPFGQSATIGALVFLEHKSGATADLRLVAPADALKTLITQNFSRAMNAAGILQILAAIAESTPAFVLEYDYVDPAIDLLDRSLGEWDKNPAKIKYGNIADFAAAPDENENGKVNKLTEAPLITENGVTEITIDGDKFVATPNGREIHYLNRSAATIWQLLKEPETPTELVAMMSTLYPDQPTEQIERDTRATIRAFFDGGLVRNNGFG